MPTGTPGNTAGSFGYCVVQFIARKFTYADAAGTYTIGYVPAGSFISDVKLAVVTAFNGSGVNTLDIGTAADTDGFAAVATLETVGVATTGAYSASDDKFTGTTDVEMKAVLVKGGGVATAGEAIAVIYFTRYRDAVGV